MTREQPNERFMDFLARWQAKVSQCVDHSPSLNYYKSNTESRQESKPIFLHRQVILKLNQKA